MSNQEELLQEVRSAWNRVYVDGDDSLPWINTTAPIVILDDFIKKLSRKKRNGNLRILDFGCGNGRLGREMEKLGGGRVDVYYYDISGKALDCCVNHGIPETRIIRDASNSSERFDGILVWGVFHHMTPQLWEPQLELVISLLAPEGAVLFGDFTREDSLFGKNESRKSEVTAIDTYAVDYEFLRKRLHVIELQDFTFEENGRFFDGSRFHAEDDPSRKIPSRTMKVAFAERYLVDQKEAKVRQLVEGMKTTPAFWHFVKYTFRDSLSTPHGKAVTFISESNADNAQKLWLEGLTLYHYHDKLSEDDPIGGKSLSEQLFLHSVRKHSFYVSGKKGKQVSVKIDWVRYEGSGQHFFISLQAPFLSINKPRKKFKETSDFGEFISELRGASKERGIKGPYETLLADIRRELKEKLESYPEIPYLPVLMMLLMVWPSKNFEKKSFVFIQPPVFQEDLGEETAEISAGGLVMFTNGPHISKRAPLISAINSWATLYTTRELVKYTRLKSVGAAIAQVMARNMSHNFGSHVLSYFITPDAYNRMGDEHVASMESYGSLQGTSLTAEVFKDKDKNHQAAYFVQYLKSRMDYLSEVTFGVSDLVTTKMMYGDVMKELDRVRILLNHISGVEDFKYRFRLLRSDEEKELTPEEDFGVAFPNDILGCQAFYNIVENIIRNTAKHGAGKTGDRDTTFTIRVRDVSLSRGLTVEDADRLYCIEIDDGIPYDDIDTLVRKQNERLNESVLDAHNNLRSHSLGLLEMKASAAFLRQIDLVDIVSEEYRVDTEDDGKDFCLYEGVRRMNIIKAFKAPVGKDRGYALGYRFFLQKPKEFLFVGDGWEKQVDSKRRNEWLRLGVEIMSASQFRAAMDSGKAFSHQFLVYDETSQADVFLKENRTLLPLRIIPDRDNILAGLLRDEKSLDMLKVLKEEAWSRFEPDIPIKDRLQVSPPRQIIMKRHKETYLEDFDGVFKGENAIFKNKEVWIENLTSRTMNKLPEFASYAYEDDPDEDGEELLSMYIMGIEQQDRIVRSLDEAYHDRVVVIDERVQQYAEENREDGIECWKLFESTNVCVPRRPMTDCDGKPSFPPGCSKRKRGDVIPLASENFQEYVPMLERYIDRNVRDSFLIIHYGILERMYNRDEKLISKKLDCWAGKAKRVVVTSGRGSHSIQLPSSVCFASLSSVLYACCESRNKYLINNLLHQARRKRK